MLERIKECSSVSEDEQDLHCVNGEVLRDSDCLNMAMVCLGFLSLNKSSLQHIL